MWVPILEAKILKNNPLRVYYWGTPVVLFKTENGKIGALEDRCAHRHVPLSKGKVVGETIECSYHHFKFNTHGKCDQIPKVFGCDRAFQNECKVRRFYVKEALNLIWISLEDENVHPFPINTLTWPNPNKIITGAFKVKGNIQVWMDHFLDAAHCIFTHKKTTYQGSQHKLANIKIESIQINEEKPYSSNPSVKFSILPQNPPPLSVIALQSGSPLKLIKNAINIASHVSTLKDLILSQTNLGFKIDIDVSLITPICQRTVSRRSSIFGDFKTEFLTSINPISNDESEFVFTGYIDSSNQNLFVNSLAHKYFKKFIFDHLSKEDAEFLSIAQFSSIEEMNLTSFDQTVISQRAMFEKYLVEKSHLFPENSLIHKIERDTEKKSHKKIFIKAS